MHVAQILKNKGDKIISVAPDQTIADACEVLTAANIGAAVVRDGMGNLVGILSERDIVRGLTQDGPELLHRTVGELMTSSLVTCTPQNSLDDVMGLMSGRRIRHLPVLENDELRGVISIGDVVKSRLDELESEASELRNFIVGG